MRIPRVWPVALALILASPLARGDGVHVRLRGAARIDAQGVRADGGELLLRGSLTDDAGAPLAEGAIGVTIARASAPPGAVAVPPSAAHACGPGAHPPRVDRDGVHVTADAAGRFCVRVSLPVERYVLHLGYAGTGYIDPGALDVQVDLSRRTCTLAFAPDPRVVSLDAKSVAIDATATLESDGATAPAASFPLVLTTERSAAPLAAGTTDGAGHARFVLDPSRLGPPGRGELRVAFAGNADAASASRVAAIERRARVSLDVPEAEGGKLGAGSPEDGVAFVVTARAVGGEVSSGSVEARVNDAVVGAAPIEGGSAKLLVTFALPEASGAAAEVPIALRYVPSSPWYEPGGESTWRLPVRGRSPLRQVWILLTGLAVAAWLIMARAQRAKALAKGLPRARVASRGEAKLDVVRLARDASEGWSGRVTDADDATGVAAARVQIERPAFGRVEVMGSVIADEEGRFVLPHASTRSGDELAIEAPLHVPLRRPLPSPGELDAQLVLRKRALLTRLVAWAKQRGRPFDARPDPTPGDVRHAAGEDFRVARWADAVERAAFGGEPVDARVEAEVDRLAPAAAAVPQAAGSGPAVDPRALANPTKPNR